MGAVVAQGRPASFDEDDPQWNQDDATDQQWFEEAHKAGLHMDDNFAASYNGHASALSQAAVADRRRWRRAGAGRIVRVPLTSSPGPGPDATPPVEGDGRPRHWTATLDRLTESGRIKMLPLTSSPRPGLYATPHHRRHASRQATRQNWPFGSGAGQEFVRRGRGEFHWEAPFHLRRRRAAAAEEAENA